ncbi:hypothetical protein BT67DRAFT_241322 [Trichocladium antarcticum]|uniref:Uncharacterized protein n=1 Tax=Trichocladium antarcticum TaxID=1450529 RepID=A0AAN6UCM4_9PEZI|nr:hypothetical protein BT67DRAFT_241322 [Trichocladium antarcticum]
MPVVVFVVCLYYEVAVAGGGICMGMGAAAPQRLACLLLLLLGCVRVLLFEMGFLCLHGGRRFGWGIFKEPGGWGYLRSDPNNALCLYNTRVILHILYIHGIDRHGRIVS